MTDFVVYDDGVVNAGAGEDRLTVIAQLRGLWLFNLSGDLASGYSGNFSTGYTGEGVAFSGIEHFTFIDEHGTGNWIATGAGNDSLVGGLGNDTLLAGAGDDTLDGGADLDWVGIDQSASTDGFLLDLNTVSTLIEGTVQNFEGFYDLRLGLGEDTVIGHQTAFLNDTIDTGAGDDLITLWNHAEHDSVTAGAGIDRLTAYLESGLSMMSFTAEATGGYGGHLGNGYSGEGIYFSGVENFTLIDEAGANNSLTTGAGDDSILGGGGNDTILAGSGDDTLDGGADTDWLGLDQSDSSRSFTLDLNAVSTLINGTVQGFEGFQGLFLGEGNDRVTGHQTAFVNDTLDTGAGDDVITLWNQAEHDSVTAGDGTDRLVVFLQAGLSTMSLYAEDAGGYGGYLGNGYAGEGVYFSGVENFSIVDLYGGNNSLITGAGDDSLDGGAGNDSLNAGTGADTIDGGAGDDYFFADYSGLGAGVQIDLATVSSVAGGTLRNLEGFGTVTGTAFADLMRGIAGVHLADVIDAGAGNDTVAIWNAAERDAITGGAGDDLLVVTTDARLSLYGISANAGGGYDGHMGTGYSGEGVYFSGIERFDLTDASGTDSNWHTGDGTDRLDGGLGNDTLQGGDGADTLIGGDGNDLLVGGDTAADGNDQLYGGAGDDSLSGGAGNDLLRGDTGRDALDGGDGADTLLGGVGIDSLSGGAGNDSLSGDADNDLLRGGDGTDTILGGTGNDSILGGDTEADLRDLIYGGDGNDSIDGGYGNDELRGDDGNDTIEGGFGADTVIGGVGNDVLTGSAWGDLLYGGDGDDFINGGFGFDRVNGGAGADRFFHIGVAGHGSDWIQDYTAADGDTLVFGIATATSAQFQINWASTPHAGDAGVQEAFVIYRPTGQILWALVDGAANDHIWLQIDGVNYDLLA